MQPNELQPDSNDVVNSCQVSNLVTVALLCGLLTSMTGR